MYSVIMNCEISVIRNLDKYLSLASSGCRLSKYIDKDKTLDDFLEGSAALTLTVIFLLKLSKRLEVVLHFAHSNCYYELFLCITYLSLIKPNTLFSEVQGIKIRVIHVLSPIQRTCYD